MWSSNKDDKEVTGNLVRFAGENAIDAAVRLQTIIMVEWKRDRAGVFLEKCDGRMEVAAERPQRKSHSSSKQCLNSFRRWVKTSEVCLD